MSLFLCSKCGVVENTALCGYWWKKGEPLCSECDPEFGRWHGRFEKKYPKKGEWKYSHGNFIELLK